MKFGEFHEQCRGRRPVISFEVFPPRNDDAARRFHQVLPELIGLRPDLITVTYGAMGSTRDQTLEIARMVKERYRIETACHLTCVGLTAQDIDLLLDRIGAAGIENIVALRGDPPKGESHFRPVPGGYDHAIALVGHIHRRGGFGIAVAGYPEKHIEAPDPETDLRHLRDKAEAGADIILTQLFYDNRAFLRFAERARAMGVRQPIVPGLLPILSAEQLRRITGRCGAGIPASLREELEAAGDDEETAQEVGIRQAVRQATELLEEGAPGIHFYVLNRSSHMQRIFAAIPRELLGR